MNIQVVHHQMDGLGFRILNGQVEGYLCELKRRPVRRGEGEVPADGVHLRGRLSQTACPGDDRLPAQSRRDVLLRELTSGQIPRQEFYKHRHNWSNRLIAGDSLLVMNSLLEKEGMAGKVQMWCAPGGRETDRSAEPVLGGEVLLVDPARAQATEEGNRKLGAHVIRFEEA
jgi:hypothetical protein